MPSGQQLLPTLLLLHPLIGDIPSRFAAEINLREGKRRKNKVISGSGELCKEQVCAYHPAKGTAGGQEAFKRALSSGFVC